jgi:hypothetical protein
MTYTFARKRWKIASSTAGASALLLAAALSGSPVRAQGTNQQPTSAQGTQQQQQPQQQHEQAQTRTAKTPSRESLYEAHKDCADLFANLANGNTEEAARWITDEVGYTRDDEAKAGMRDSFRQKLDAVVASPPASPYGKLSGYDLLEESYLPNSARYFRMVYISYHEGAPLVWEFRFYVRPDGHVALENVEWSEKNPFEYMATPEMLYPKILDK